MKRWRWPAALMLTIMAAPLLASCGHAGTSAAPAASESSAVVDRHDPQSVLRAYFDAWLHGDWSRQESFNAQHYANTVYEPVNSIRILELHRLDGATATRVTYAVSFEIEVKGQGVSMQSGRYDWTYELTWDPARDAWLITNHGGG